MLLIREDVAREIQAHRDSGVRPTAEQIEAVASDLNATVEAASRPVRKGSVAEISVEGLLMNAPDPLLAFFGVKQSTYQGLISALGDAERDSGVERAVLNINSPGGHVDGLFEALAAIEAFSKPIETRATRATSAAYALAAATDRITASSVASEFGSVGIVASAFVSDSIVDITSTDAPNKRPDLKTEEGKAEIRKYLDAVHDLFVDAIARGRAQATGDGDLDKDAVNSGFGRGATLLARDALNRKMIDVVERPPRRANRGARQTRAADEGATETTKENGNMTLEELKAQHPQLCSQLVEQGREEGRADATKAERRRCADHLKMGKASGIMDDAIKAVEDGTEFADMQATYLAAHMNKRDVDARQADSDAAEATIANAEPAPNDGDMDLVDRAAQAAFGSESADGLKRNKHGDIIL